MTRFRQALTGACLAAAMIAGPAAAQGNILDIKPGEVVHDPEGGTIGTVRSVTGDTAVVDTGTAKITLGLDSFRRPKGKLALSMSRAVLEAEAAKVQASGDAAVLAMLTPGARFFDVAGAEVGTVVKVEGKQVLVAAGEIKAHLPLSAFVQSAKGPAIRSTQADFMAKLAIARAKPEVAGDSKQP